MVASIKYCGNYYGDADRDLPYYRFRRSGSY
jgi:hypothetical protein